MQPGASPQGRETGSGSSSRRARAAWFLPPHPAKAVSALNRCSEMGEQLFGLQPQDRQHDSSEQEHGECTMFLSVCLKGGKATVEPLPVTDQRSDFSLCPVSEGQPHKHTLTRTHTHTHRVMNRGCNDSRVCLSEHFVFRRMNSSVRCLCICVPASVRVTGKQQGGREQWPATCRRSQDTSIRRTGAYTPSPPSNPRCPRAAKACFVSLPPALCPVTLL